MKFDKKINKLFETRKMLLSFENYSKELNGVDAIKLLHLATDFIYLTTRDCISDKSLSLLLNSTDYDDLVSNFSVFLNRNLDKFKANIGGMLNRNNSVSSICIDYIIKLQDLEHDNLKSEKLKVNIFKAEISKEFITFTGHGISINYAKKINAELHNINTINKLYDWLDSKIINSIKFVNNNRY